MVKGTVRTELREITTGFGPQLKTIVPPPAIAAFREVSLHDSGVPEPTVAVGFETKIGDGAVQNAGGSLRT